MISSTCPDAVTGRELDMLLERDGSRKRIVVSMPGRFRGCPRTSPDPYAEELRTLAMKAMEEAGLKGRLARPDDAGIALYLRLTQPYSSRWGLRQRIRAVKGLMAPQKSPSWHIAGKVVSRALTGVVWEDERLVTSAEVRKAYGEGHGIEVTVSWTEKE